MTTGAEFGVWVPAAERLPEEGQPVVLYRPLAYLTQDPAICIGWNTGRKNESPQGVKHTFDCWCHPTHWLPLPATPNVEFSGGAPLFGAASAGTQGYALLDKETKGE